MIELKQREVNSLARRIAKVNTALWNAICLTEELMYDDTVKTLTNDHEEFQELFLKIATAYSKLKKNDEEFVNVGMRARVLDDFDDLCSTLQNIIDEN